MEVGTRTSGSESFDSVGLTYPSCPSRPSHLQLQLKQQAAAAEAAAQEKELMRARAEAQRQAEALAEEELQQVTAECMDDGCFCC